MVKWINAKNSARDMLNKKKVVLQKSKYSNKASRLFLSGKLCIIFCYGQQAFKKQAWGLNSFQVNMMLYLLLCDDILCLS